jgi:proteasome assembly chaperone (PAC2) family protein
MMNEHDELQKLNRPWMVAVWPGMGNVALSAGYYLMAKLGMHQLAEFSADTLFDIDHMEVKEGIIQAPHRPRSRIFVWKAPEGQRDVVVFIGEAQPPIGKYNFCEKLIEFAEEIGVERLFTFAAMATSMNPSDESRVFAASTSEELKKELDQPAIYLLDEGHISGLNGVLVGAALEKGMPGVCLLGEMPGMFAQLPLPFPKGSLAVLRVFAEMAAVQVDFAELEEQVIAVDQKYKEIIESIEKRVAEGQDSETTESFGFPMDNELSDQDREHIESLFEEAEKNRSKAYELKRELDRMEVFDEYEDRFLDLFKPEE